MNVYIMLQMRNARAAGKMELYEWTYQVCVIRPHRFGGEGVLIVCGRGSGAGEDDLCQVELDITRHDEVWWGMWYTQVWCIWDNFFEYKPLWKHQQDLKTPFGMRMAYLLIAVAISALAGESQKRFRTETAIFAPSPEAGGVCAILRRFLGVWASEGMGMESWVILGHFGKKYFSSSDPHHGKYIDIR